MLISLKFLSEIPDEEEGEKPKEFIPSKGLSSEEAKVLLEKWGRNELTDKKKPKVSCSSSFRLPVMHVFSGSSLWNNYGNPCLL